MFGIELSLILSYAGKLVFFGAFFAILYPLIERLILRAPPSRFARRVGLALFAGGLYGAADLGKASGIEAIHTLPGLAASIALLLVMIGGLVIIRKTAPARRT